MYKYRYIDIYVCFHTMPAFGNYAREVPLDLAVGFWAACFWILMASYNLLSAEGSGQIGPLPTGAYVGKIQGAYGGDPLWPLQEWAAPWS